MYVTGMVEGSCMEICPQKPCSNGYSDLVISKSKATIHQRLLKMKHVHHFYRRALAGNMEKRCTVN